jgi:hypothetical protein
MRLALIVIWLLLVLPLAIGLLSLFERKGLSLAWLSVTLLPFSLVTFWVIFRPELHVPTGFVLWVLVCAIPAVVIVSNCKIYTKAGQPAWAALIPFYNTYILLKIINRPWWWLLLMLIPGVGFVWVFLAQIDLAKSFGKDVSFGIGLVFIPVIFQALLAFGNASYSALEHS